MSRTSSPLVTSVRVAEHTAASFEIARAAESAFPPSMSESSTFAPSRTKRAAIARPIPWPAPVTTATFSLRRINVPSRIPNPQHGTTAMPTHRPGTRPRGNGLPRLVRKHPRNGGSTVSADVRLTSGRAAHRIRPGREAGTVDFSGLPPSKPLAGRAEPDGANDAARRRGAMGAVHSGDDGMGALTPPPPGVPRHSRRGRPRRRASPADDRSAPTRCRGAHARRWDRAPPRPAGPP